MPVPEAHDDVLAVPGHGGDLLLLVQLLVLEGVEVLDDVGLGVEVEALEEAGLGAHEGVQVKLVHLGTVFVDAQITELVFTS